MEAGVERGAGVEGREGHTVTPFGAPFSDLRRRWDGQGFGFGCEEGPVSPNLRRYDWGFRVEEHGRDTDFQEHTCHPFRYHVDLQCTAGSKQKMVCLARFGPLFRDYTLHPMPKQTIFTPAGTGRIHFLQTGLTCCAITNFVG